MIMHVNETVLCIIPNAIVVIQKRQDTVENCIFTIAIMN